MVPTDFSRTQFGPADPVTRGAIAVPTDGVALPFVTRRVYIGTAGALAVTMRDDHARTKPPLVIPNLAVGWHEISVREIWATGTSASNILIFG